VTPGSHIADRVSSFPRDHLAALLGRGTPGLHVTRRRAIRWNTRGNRNPMAHDRASLTHRPGGRRGRGSVTARRACGDDRCERRRPTEQRDAFEELAPRHAVLDHVADELLLEIDARPIVSFVLVPSQTRRWMPDLADRLHPMQATPSPLGQIAAIPASDDGFATTAGVFLAGACPRGFERRHRMPIL
jgi:hypothetical protein